MSRKYYSHTINKVLETWNKNYPLTIKFFGKNNTEWINISEGNKEHLLNILSALKTNGFFNSYIESDEVGMIGFQVSNGYDKSHQINMNADSLSVLKAFVNRNIWLDN